MRRLVSSSLPHSTNLAWGAQSFHLLISGADHSKTLGVTGGLVVFKLNFKAGGHSISLGLCHEATSEAS